LRRRRFGAAVVLRFDFWWGALTAQLAGIRQRVGYLTPETEPFLTCAIDYERKARHEVERNLVLVDGLLRSVGVDPAAPAGRGERLEFHTTTSDEAEADGVLARHGIRRADRLVAIHAGAGSPLKWWSEDGFADVADRLASVHGCRIILTGQEAEAGLVRGIERRASCAPIGVVGETSLSGLAALYRRCECVIGSDSGPMHIAVAMGTPTVHLFGPADERLFGPWGDPTRHIVVRTRVECAPCGNLDECTGHFGFRACMTRITPDAVVEAARRALAAGRAGDPAVGQPG
jgi:heptosyltransferase-2/heptosyltransferase-3